MATLLTAAAQPLFQGISCRNRPFATKLCLIASDTASLVLSVGISIFVKAITEGGLLPAGYLRLWPFLGLFLLVYAAMGLYSIVALSPAQERGRATAASALLFLLLSAATVSFRGAQRHFTWTLFLALGISVVLLPVLRNWTRARFAHQEWWGFPAVIFGAGEGGRRLLAAMRRDSNMGLKPIAFIDERADFNEACGLRVYHRYEDAQRLAEPGVQVYAVFANQDLPAHDRDELVDRHRSHFSHILVVPEMNDILSLRVDSKNVAGMLGLEIRPGV